MLSIAIAPIVARLAGDCGGITGGPTPVARKLSLVRDGVATTSEEGSRRARFPFRRKLALAFGTLAVLPVAAIGALLLDANEDALRRSTLELQISVADNVGTTVTRQLRDATRATEEIGEILGDGTMSPDERLRLATDRFERSGLLRLTILDADGETIDTFRRQSPPEVEWAPVALDAPIVDRGGQRTGSVRGEMPVDPIRERMFALGDRHPGAAGDIVVMNAEREPVVATTPEWAFVPDGRDREMLAVGPTSAPLLAPIAVESEDSITTLAPVAGDESLIVLVRTSRTAAFATLRELRTFVIATCVALAVLALLAALLLARRITRPLESLSRFAGDLAERRFDAPLVVDTRDEIGALAEDMRRSAKELAASEERVLREEAIRADLGRYLAADLVERIVKREQAMELGGRRADITVLFADVVAFTPLSRTLPPEDVVALLNELFTLLTEAVFRHGGTVDKLVGDAVMAVFGAPADDPDHARSAVETAEAMMAIVETASAGWQERYGVGLQLAIGIHSGEAVVGNVGSERRMDYTAIGEVVNLASRLETIARPRQILISAATAERLGDDFELVSVGERAVGESAMALFEVQP